jgi:hypothetical protein
MEKFTSIRNFFLKKVMGFNAKNLNVKEDSRKPIENPSLSKDISLPEEDLFLNKEELKYLLSLIKNSSFQGKDIEILYNLSWKLQKAFLFLDKD